MTNLVTLWLPATECGTEDKQEETWHVSYKRSDRPFDKPLPNELLAKMATGRVRSAAPLSRRKRAKEKSVRSKDMKVEIHEAVQQHTGTAHQRPHNKRPRAAPRRNLKIGKSSAEEQSDEKRAADATN